MDYDQAVEFLNSHIELGWKPGLERMEYLMDLMGSPQLQYPVIHVAGTNGKTTVARTVTAIVTAMGLKAGTYTSPHLERIEERFDVAGEVTSQEGFAQAISDVAPFIDILEQETGERTTYFELTTAGAFAHFASATVDVGVIEVGLGGRLDATNVVQSQVAVVTGISIEHTDYLGDTLELIGGEKLAILKPGGSLVTGYLPDVVNELAIARAEEVGTPHRAIGRDFHTDNHQLGVGGWAMDVEGIYERYDDLFLPMHGEHQVGNAAVAIAAVEELFGKGLPDEVVREGLATIQSPGRIEVVSQDPLVVVDGAHNPEAFDALAVALSDELPDLAWTLVVGAMGDKDIDAMLGSLEGIVTSVVATSAEHERAFVPGQVAEAAERALPGVPVVEVDGVANAVLEANEIAGSDGGIIIAGSLYVVGEARGLF